MDDHAHRQLAFLQHCDEIRRDGFICGDREIDTWFRNKSINHHKNRVHIVTCVCFDDELGKPIGFYALSVVVEDATKLPNVGYRPFFGNPQYFPCLSLVYVAVQQTLQGKRIGSTMMGRVITEFADIGEKIGLPLLILTPLNSRAAAFYRGLGFAAYKKGSGMFLSIDAAIEARNASS